MLLISIRGDACEFEYGSHLLYAKRVTGGSEQMVPASVWSTVFQIYSLPSELIHLLFNNRSSHWCIAHSPVKTNAVKLAHNFQSTLSMKSLTVMSLLFKGTPYRLQTSSLQSIYYFVTRKYSYL